MIKHVDREIEEYKKLTGQKKHYCPEWDYMAIDENSPEFEACSCQLEPVTVEVSFPDGKRSVPAHFDPLRPTSYIPDDIEGFMFLEVLGAGWCAFRK